MRKPPIPENEEEIRAIVNQAIEEVEAMDFVCNRLVPLEMCEEDVFGCFLEEFEADQEEPSSGDPDDPKNKSLP